MENSAREIFVTGANGFVGQALCRYLLEKGYSVRAAGRQAQCALSHPNLCYFQVDLLDESTDWISLLHGVDVVIHLASRVHQLKDVGMSALSQYQAVNVEGTRRLIRGAIQSVVRRCIFISSIKVNGEQTKGSAFRAEDKPNPLDAYGISKYQAEKVVQMEAKGSGMEWVIIRPPLVYGQGVKGNFRRLMSLASIPLPLPFGVVHNKRSLVSVDNLNHFVECCLSHPNAKNEIFLVSDKNDLSTKDLIATLRLAQARRAWVFPFPIMALKALATLFGKRREANRLFDSLQVNIEKSTRLLGWQPPLSVKEAIEKAVSTS